MSNARENKEDKGDRALFAWHDLTCRASMPDLDTSDESMGWHARSSSGDNPPPRQTPVLGPSRRWLFCQTYESIEHARRDHREA